MAQSNATVQKLRAMAEDDTLSCERLRAILIGVADSVYHASYGDLVIKEQELAVMLAGSVTIDTVRVEDRIVRMV